MKPDAGAVGSLRLFFLDDDIANAPEWELLVKKLDDKISVVDGEVWVWEGDRATKDKIEELLGSSI